MTRLQRGVSSGRWSASHVARAKQQLAQLAVRRRHLVENATMYNPAQGLSGESLRKTVDQLTEGELAPLRREREGIAAQGAKSAGDIEALYRGLATSMQGSVASSRALNERGMQATRDIGTAQQQALGNIGQQVVGQVSDEYAPGAKERLAALSAQRQGQAVDVQAARQQTAQNLASTNQGLLEQMAASGQMQGAEAGAQARSATTSRLADVAGRISDVEGPGRTKLLRQLIGEERQFSSDQAVLNSMNPYQAAQIGIAKDKNRLARAKEKARQREAARHGNQWGYTDREWRALSPTKRQSIIKQQKRWGMKPGGSSKGGGAGGLTPLQQRQVEKDRNRASADVRATVQAHPNILRDNPRGKRLRGQAITTIMQRYGYSHAEAMTILRRHVKIPKAKKRTVADRKTPR